MTALATPPTLRPSTEGPTGPAGSRPDPSGPRGRRPGRPTTAPTRLPAAERSRAAERLAAALATWYLDAQAGRRDVHQLGLLLTPTAAGRVAASVLRATSARRRGGTAASTMLRVRRVVVQEVGGRYEAIAMVEDGPRTVPVVSVLHPTERGWRVSDLARPDDNVPALRPPPMRTTPRTPVG